ncbi:hypothetical protein FVE85_4151 [Porphyridium purpureum]|uniref:Uncharacterized protein n=1 Tax=Porphyridium purpureum TaxID=35688 RepID=A0A5J4YS68_PORPP|nr:hypothetical protein FVE85_4151 [Porphyridium purpureum]|eukprot:POR6956..scf229_5
MAFVSVLGIGVAWRSPTLDVRLRRHPKANLGTTTVLAASVPVSQFRSSAWKSKASRFAARVARAVCEGVRNNHSHVVVLIVLGVVVLVLGTKRIGQTKRERKQSDTIHESENGELQQQRVHHSKQDQAQASSVFRQQPQQQYSGQPEHESVFTLSRSEWLENTDDLEKLAREDLSGLISERRGAIQQYGIDEVSAPLERRSDIGLEGEMQSNGQRIHDAHWKGSTYSISFRSAADTKKKAKATPSVAPEMQPLTAVEKNQDMLRDRKLDSKEAVRAAFGTQHAAHIDHSRHWARAKRVSILGSAANMLKWVKSGLDQWVFPVFFAIEILYNDLKAQAMWRSQNGGACDPLDQCVHLEDFSSGTTDESSDAVLRSAPSGMRRTPTLDFSPYTKQIDRFLNDLL